MGGGNESLEELATPDYWDQRYEKSDGQTATHEWFRTYSALVPFFTEHLFQPFPSNSNPHILHLGSGDSTIPLDLHGKGYKNQLCLDFSQVVVDLMSRRCATLKGIEWQWGDVRDMRNIADGCVDVAFDKGTLDAMIHGSVWDPPDEVKINTGAYVREVSRALRAGGVFLYITYRQPHFVRPLIDLDDLWKIEMDTLSDPEGSSFDYFGFVLTKR